MRPCGRLSTDQRCWRPLCRRTDRNRRSRALAGRGRDRRIGRSRPSNGSEKIVSPPRALSELCPPAEPDLRSSRGTPKPFFTGDYRLPLRGCFPFVPRGPTVLACREIAYPLRHGTVSGKGLRPGSTVSFPLDPGLGAPTGLSRPD